MKYLVSPGMWKERRTTKTFMRSSALFLDRDGVVNIDHGYVGSPDRVELLEFSAQLISHANRAGLATVIVTNQSGIGRGFFNWQDFAATMDKIHRLLARFDATVDMVCACAYHSDAQGSYKIANHPMRKPNPGMINLACDTLNLNAAGSYMIGDSLSDMQAALSAGISRGAYIGSPISSGGLSKGFQYFNPAEQSKEILADFLEYLAEN